MTAPVSALCRAGVRGEDGIARKCVLGKKKENLESAVIGREMREVWSAPSLGSGALHNAARSIFLLCEDRFFAREHQPLVESGFDQLFLHFG